MANRQVTRSGKDRDGDITRLCGAWGNTPKATAIDEIERHVHRYYVEDAYRRQANVIVVNGRWGKHLRTDPDSSCMNNLDNIPDC